MTTTTTMRATSGLTRREFLEMLAVGAAAGGLASCIRSPTATFTGFPARLLARPGEPTQPVATGLTDLRLGTTRSAFLYVPRTYDAGGENPLMLALHGAGGDASGPITMLSPYADRYGLVLVAISSSGSTWDATRGQFGPDVAVADEALRLAFDRCRVDPRRVFIEGFSDGASYALGLGPANGDLFSRVVGFSPGFIPDLPQPPVGRPAVWLSHGRSDTVLPFQNDSDRIVPALRAGGYAVTFTPFDGGHSVPPDIALAAMQWLAG